MQCPKCGASQPVTNKECPSCGIIFDRWQPRAPRRTTSSSTPIPPVPPPTRPIVDPESASPSISNTLVAVGLGVLLIIGFAWTKHVQNSRPKTNSLDETINQINNSGSKARSDLQNRSNRGGSAVKASAVWTAQKLPADLDESKIRDIIESCSFFQNEVNIDIPKRLDARTYSLGLNNTLALAVRDHLVEFDPPIDSNLPYGEPVNVKVTQYASSKVTVVDNGDSYRLGLGRRHVQVTSARQSGNTVTATFTWTLDQSEAADLSPEGTNPSGGADIQHAINGWTLTRAWQKSGGSIRYICQ